MLIATTKIIRNIASNMAEHTYLKIGSAGAKNSANLIVSVFLVESRHPRHALQMYVQVSHTQVRRISSVLKF